MSLNTLIRPLCLTLLGSLIILSIIQSHLVVTQQGVAWHLVYPVKILPLLAFLPFLWKNHKRAYIWMGFVLCLYFMQPVVELVSGVNVLLNALFITNIIALFISAILFIRRYTQ
ncbi:MAG: DUF2069 domain-containing protein [Hahellaceae bacterium]|nr:DUF2069 domain-containing protein [Hahellaceae bacterium]